MTKDFEEWAKDMNYKLEKEQYKPSEFRDAWVYKNTHTQSAWSAWNSACILYTGNNAYDLQEIYQGESE